MGGFLNKQFREEVCSQGGCGLQFKRLRPGLTRPPWAAVELLPSALGRGGQQVTGGYSVWSCFSEERPARERRPAPLPPPPGQRCPGFLVVLQSLFFLDQGKTLVPAQYGSCRGRRRSHWRIDSKEVRAHNPTSPLGFVDRENEA